VAEQVRLPLTCVATVEPVEVLEAHPNRPLIEWAVLARLKRRRVVVFAKPRCSVAVVLENATDRRLVTRNDAVVAGIPGRLLGHNAEATRVKVAPGNERSAGRRTQRRGMEVRIAQSLVGDPVHRR